ncbi:MAG: hypothetical protein BZ138_00530 [Methanosphaera sp. rholeuAM270]|nr:MAG: hypothetical protein BZ138_00530 [Methanosphaera sp. rholeuAM270]
MKAYKTRIKLDIEEEVERTILLPINLSFKKLHELILVLFNIIESKKYNFILEDINLEIHETGSIKRDIIDSKYELIDKYFKALPAIRYNNGTWKFALTISKDYYEVKYPEIIEFKGKYNPSHKINTMDKFSRTLKLMDRQIEIHNDLLLEETLTSLQEKTMVLFDIPYAIENNKFVLLKEEGTLNKYIHD